MSRQDSTKIEDVKVMLLKGDKGDKGDGVYDDTELREGLSAEITARERDDVSLGRLISDETTAREEADSTLESTKADKTALESEASARQTADEYIDSIKADKTALESETLARASADSNLQSQIDQIVAPSGEAPSVAEVENARIGVDDFTYNSLGNAIRGQINDGIDRFKSIKESAINYVSMGEFLDDTWLNTQGIEQFSSGWSATRFIELKGHDIVGIFGTVPTSWCWFYDSNKNPISTVTSINGLKYFNVPSNAKYIRISNTTTGLNGMRLYDDNQIVISPTGFLDLGDLQTNIWINSNYVESSALGWSTTKYVELPLAYSSLIIYSPNDTLWVYFYDSNKDPISTVHGLTGEKTYPIPTNAKYVRISNTDSAFENIKVFGDGAIVNKLMNESIISNNNGYPTYYNSHLSDKINEINLKIAGSTQKDAFVFITDIHYRDNALHSPKLIEDICRKTGITTVQLNGDYINRETVKANALTQINRICGMYQYAGVDTFITVGNHEYNNPSNSSDSEYRENELSESELRFSILNRLKKKVVFDPNSLSYYYDNEDAKIRYFVGEVGISSNVVTKSIKWLAEQLLNVPSGYGVVVMFHTILKLTTDDGTGEPTLVLTAVDLAEILDSAKNKTSVVFGGVTYDYSNKDFEIICALCGDYHLDMDYTTDGGVLIIMTTTDSLQQWQGWGTPLVRTSGTITEQAFDVVIIDRQHQKISLKRIGAGDDREYLYASQ